MTANLLNLTKLRDWLRIGDTYLPKQYLLFAHLKENVQIPDGKLLKKDQTVRIICRVEDNRYAVTSQLNQDSSEVIITQEMLSNIRIQ